MSLTSVLERYEAECKSQAVKENDALKVVLEKHSLATSSEVCLRGNLPALRKSRLTDGDVNALLTGILACPVSHLNLSYNHITDDGAKHIASYLKQCFTVEHLDISYNDIRERGIEEIADALQLNFNLKSLNVSGNKFGNKGGLHIPGMLQVNTTLEYIDVADADLSAESVIAFATVLNQNGTVKYLNLNRPLIYSRQEETTVHIAKMLKVNTGLQEIHLQKHGIRDFGAEWLHDTLKHNLTLTHLDLSRNRIGRDGAAHLACLLTQDTRLTHLDLSYNRIEDDGAIAISNALTHYNRNLKMLAIRGNEIGGLGLCAIAKAIKANPTLTQIYIWGNTMDEKTCKEFSSLTSGIDPRINPADTDIQAYVVDGVTYLAQVT
ncbi:leucine-rich repeat-containing protein 34-like [Corticium candelabrum]|uniref:leucine-rich repeat-containing protein 34-like n=1 Tax=Corticium candelabrum TaxID=121492 RepID=UPI002E26942E|nr:leucine-rich repeat-containing protein 34-like [Corticium candelabrum]